MRAWQFAKAQHAGPIRFVSMQTRYNLVYREEEREMLPLCRDQGVGVLPYSPLARGLLARGPDVQAGGPGVRAGGSGVRAGGSGVQAHGSGVQAGGSAERSARASAEGRALSGADAGVVRALADVAAARGVPPAQVALAWVLGRPGVSAPIVGATKVGQVDDAVTAVDLEVTDKEVAALEAPYLPHEPFGY
jgi:aryl-alcohol dehydrogenase-like predicted oxidoreductase